MKIRIALILLVAIFLTSCASAGRAERERPKWEKEMFSRFYDTDGEQADTLFESVIHTVQEENSTSLRGLFAPNSLSDMSNADEKICLLFRFYEGEMVSYQRYGPGSYSSKDGDSYSKVIEASYDVVTTADTYRIAIRFCTVDSNSPDNIGLQSMYITKAEDSNMEFAYWGNDMSVHDIVVETVENK